MHNLNRLVSRKKRTIEHVHRKFMIDFWIYIEKDNNFYNFEP